MTSFPFFAFLSGFLKILWLAQIFCLGNGCDGKCILQVCADFALYSETEELVSGKAKMSVFRNILAF